MNANSVYPLIHEAMLPLLARWLKHKRLYGSAIERAMYKDMGLVQFIHRLLEKRAVHFYESVDSWKLIDGKTGVNGWENVGTDQEKEPLVSYLSYLYQFLNEYLNIVLYLSIVLKNNSVLF